ncbi:hypothetical protein [Solibacillus sp. FSL H8-0538]|uniref:hypothetical protein n=1 Tax=Solibacillus sp. FSL H8-0538 TaxID=2921400 RepID=UPI0030F9ABAA
MKSLKAKVNDWIVSIYEDYLTNNHENIMIRNPIYFKLDGFADEPEVYILATDEGLEFGYEATFWDGYMPAPLPGIFKKHSSSWQELQSLSTAEQQEIILKRVMKTINSRKRQYRKCLFCGEHVAAEHRFNNDTCHGCASAYLGVVY